MMLVSLYRNAILFSENQNKSIHWVASSLHLCLGMIYFEQAEMELAEKYLQQSKELSEQQHLDDWPYQYHLAQARKYEILGDYAGALDMLKEAERLYFPNPTLLLRPIPALEARILLQMGRLAEATTSIEKLGVSVQTDTEYVQEYSHLVLVRILLAEGNTEDAFNLLERLLHSAEVRGGLGSIIEMKIIQALGYQDREDTAALKALEHALALAEAESFIQVFIDEGRPMDDMLTVPFEQLDTTDGLGLERY